MAKFSRRSASRLYTCCEEIQVICFRLIKNFDFTVLCGHRGEEEQNKVYDEKKSQLKFPESKHNKTPSLAIDLCPYPIDWEDTDRFIFLGGHMIAIANENNINLRWGGNWKMDNDLINNGWNDYPHYEILEK